MIRTKSTVQIGGEGVSTQNGITVGLRGNAFTRLMKRLFANNEQGFFYDPNDLSTMFQDAAGTVPVTAVGQPVGLMLDKSKGLFLSSNLIANGSFKDGTAGWTLGGAATLVNGAVSLTGGGAASTLKCTVTLEVDKTYLLTAKVFNRVGAGLTNENGSTLGFNGTRVFKATKGVTDIYFRCFGAVGSNNGASITDIELREVSKNFAYQTTSASRPILRKNAATGANYLEFDGTDDFLVTSSIDFTGTDKISLFAGVVKLANRVSMLCELSANTNTELGSFYITAPESSSGTYAFKSRGQTATNPAPVNSSGTSAYDVSVLSAFGNISGGNNTLRRNAVSTTTAANLGLGNFGNHPLYIGRRGGTSLPFNGHIYSLIGVGRLATVSEIAAIEKELAKRTGVTLGV